MPANDAFGSATVITGASGTASGTNTGATSESGEPDVDGGHSVWWSWTAPRPGLVTFINTSVIDAQLAAFTGTVVTALTTVAVDEDEESQITFLADSGTTYHIRLDGLTSDDVGSVGFSWLLPDPDLATTVDLAWSFEQTAALLPVESWDGDDDDAWTLGLQWSFLVNLEPPEDTQELVALTRVADDGGVAETHGSWNSDVPFIRRASPIMPAPTFAQGRPHSWHPTRVIHEDWGVLKLHVGGRDLTRPRGKLFVPLTDSHTEPFGHGAASFAFPGLTGFDHPHRWGLRPFEVVRLRRKDAAGNLHNLYQGFLASIEPDTGQGLTIQCIGVSGRLDLLQEPPALFTERKDSGKLIAEAINRKRHLYGLNIGEMRHRHTNIPATTSSQFTELMSGAVQDWLGLMTRHDGSQWTITDRRRRMVLHVKDMTTVHATVSYGTPGIDVQLSHDHTTAVTAVYGSGSTQHRTWLGARFPNLVDTDVPAFPLSVGATFVAGDSHGGFAPFAAFLRRGQYGSIASDDHYLTVDVGNVKQFQSRAGITVDGVVGAQTWEAAFQPGFNQGSVRGAYVGTIYERRATRRFLTNGQGARTGHNPHYDPHVPRIETYIPFGDHTPKNIGRRSARQIVRRDHPAGYTGTITLTADPEECSRFHLRAGMNIRVKHLHRHDSVLCHIVQRDRDWQTGTVTLTVDTKSRDKLTSAAVHQRNRDVADLVRRQKFGKTRSRVFNDFGQWLEEDGAGGIPLMNQQGGFWNVQRIAAGPEGQLVRISVALGSGLTEHLLNRNLSNDPPSSIPGAATGCVAIFTRPIKARHLTALEGLATPLSQLGDGSSPWDVNHDRLSRRYGLIYVAGGPGQRIGYFPGSDPGDGSGTVTGRFEDGGGVTFGPTGYYWLWVAVYTAESCLVGGQLFPGGPQ